MSATAIWLNDLDNSFTAEFVSTTAGPVFALQGGDLAAAELNGEPGLELINTGQNSATSGPYTHYYENFDEVANGNGWLPSTSPFKPARFGSISVADVDDDGDLDVLIVGDTADSNGGSSNGYESILYLNDGSGGFTDAGAGLAGASGDSAFGDVDNDGDPDLVIVGADQSNQPTATLYINDGQGGFTDSGATLTGLRATQSAVLFVDVDGDSDLDLMLSGDAGADFPGTPTTILYLNGLM